MNFKNIAYILIALLAVSQAEAIDTGKKCPDFELISNDNSRLKLSQFKGKVVYLDFWASWCAPCKKSFPWINQLQEDYGNQGLQIIGINLDSARKDADNFLSSHKAQFKIAFDPEGKVAPLYTLATMPSSFLIDRDGNLVASYEGFHEEEATQIRKDIEAQLKGDK